MLGEIALGLMLAVLGLIVFNVVVVLFVYNAKKMRWHNSKLNISNRRKTDV